MKKIFLPLLAALLCLLLTACGKTEAVKNIEAQIDSIEEVTLETGDALAAIEAAYEALSEEEKKPSKITTPSSPTKIPTPSCALWAHGTRCAWTCGSRKIFSPWTGPSR